MSATKWNEAAAVEAVRGWFPVSQQISKLHDTLNSKPSPMGLMFPEDYDSYALSVDYALFDRAFEAAQWLAKNGHEEVLIDVQGTLSRHFEAGELCCILDAMHELAPRIEQLRAKAHAFLSREASRNAHRAKHCSHADQVARKRDAERKRKEREAKREHAKERIRQLETQIQNDYANDAADDAA